MSSDLGIPYAGNRIDEPATRSPACPACGRHSQPEAAFCAFCGTALVHQRIAGPPVFAAVAAALEGRSAYEVLHEVGGLFESLGAVFEGVSQAPATLVALFPPKEDAAVVAARAALDAARTCPDVRLGIDASEVTERSDQDAIWQYLIDRSVELQALAAPGTIVPGEEILPLTEGAAVIEPLDDGSETPSLRALRDLRAASVSAPETPAPVEPVGARETPFIGRERELADLMARFATVRDEGRAVCVAVIGEVGVGRTRVLAELAASLPNVMIRRLGCEPPIVGAVDGWPIEELIECVAGLTGDESSADARAVLEGFVGHLPDGDRVVERLAHLASIDGGVAGVDETRWAVRRLFETVFDEPAVLLVDDVDQVSFGFSSFLADIGRALNSTPLLIVCTAAGEISGITDTIPMAPFDAATAERWVDARLGAAGTGVAGAIAGALGTNPLALEHGLALLIGTSALSRDAGGWNLTANPPTVPAGGSTRDVLDVRMRVLPADVRATAALAAVGGTTVRVPTLLAAGDGGSPTDVERHLAELVDQGILMPDGTGLTFAHPLVREAAAAGVPPAAAADAHVRFARAELNTAGPRRRRHAGAAGTHLAAAARLRANAAADDTDRVDAIDLLSAAAEHAADVGDAAGAAIMERRVAALLDKSDALRVELLYRAAAHEVGTGRLHEAEAAINAAMAATVGDSGDGIDHRVRILRASLRASVDRTTLDGARAIADEAYERSAELEDEWGLACAAALRGQVHAARGHAAAVVDDLSEAAERARASGHPIEAARALRGVGRALLDGPMPVERAIARCERLRADAAGHPLAEQDLAGVHAVLLARRGRFDEARALIGDAIATTEGLVADADLAVALHRAGVIGWLAGEFHAAEPPIQRALAAAAHARDDRLRASIAASWANLVLATEDRVEEAMALADVAETWATDPTALVGWRTARARALVRLGDVERADRLGRQAVSLAEQTDSSDLRANALLHLAEVLHLSERPNEAQPFERRAFRLLERTGASAQAAAVFPNLSPDSDTPSPEEDDDADIVPEDAGVTETVFEDGDEPAPEPEPEADQASEVETAGDKPEIVEEERPLPPPIAEAFAASSEAEKRKRGRFRR
ncbi:MAG: hypothetical protein E6G37_04885 [Actinobacteria bacterium]|nr:MAG: hypothetical protein E6G37_04885 [Actinomycetota bacterium]